MKFPLKEHLEQHPRFRGDRGLRRLAQALANLEAPPEETCLPATATKMEHAAAASIGRAWHKKRTEHYLSMLLAADGNDAFDRQTESRIEDLLGLKRGSVRTLHMKAAQKGAAA